MRTRTRTCRLHLDLLEDRSVPSTLAAFDLDSPDRGPFPSDRFTVADASQLTGLRVNLPLPDAATRPSDYDDLSVVNTLDGFNLQPRLSISFDGPIDVNTVNSNDVFVIRLGDTQNPQDRGGQVVGINQVVWDPATNTLHVESDQLLDQHTRYALIVTRGVQDAAGQPVEASDEFARFRHDLSFGQADDPALKEYRKDLLSALEAARQAGVAGADVVTASVFTTQSATAVLEKIRDQVHAATPAPADFLLGPGGERTVFDLGNVASITWNQQTRVAGPLNPVAVNVSLLRFIPGTVGQVAFGKYVSPNYETAEQFIPQVGTRSGTPVVQGVNEVFFNLYLPSGLRPAGGWPVAIFGHGVGGSKQGGGGGIGGGASLALAASLAERGIATIAINVVGHGFGPLSTLTVRPSVGAPVTFLEGGRGIDQDGDGIIANNEGINAAPPQSIIRDRDGQRQTVADLMQLVRVIEVGVDADGNGNADLDPSRIYYLGQSLGGIYGTEFLAVEPSVHVGVLNVAGGLGGNNRLSPVFRAAAGTSLASRTPSLLNGPGVNTLDGVSVLGPRFDENLPLRDGVPLTVRLADGTERVIQSPVINTVPGAMPIQEVLEHYEWVSQSGDPMAYAPHIRKAPLAGVPAKSVILQFAKGDQIVPNPATTALLRAGDLADRATYYRHDLAFAENPQLPTNPHAFLATLDIPGFRAITLGAQEQVATFFATDGAAVIHPEPARFFETPVSLPLPEGLNYILPTGLGGAAGNPVTIDSVVINDGLAQRSMVNSLTITFDRVVTFDPGAFGLQRQDGTEVGLNVVASVIGGRTVAVLTFTGTDVIGGSLTDGGYTLTIRGNHIRDEQGRELDGDGDGNGGGDRTEAFFRLFGDSDGDHDVDWLDRDLFRSAFGKHAGDPGYLWFLDFDGDGDVDGHDNGQFNRRFTQQ
jgi:hypothetical protein